MNTTQNSRIITSLQALWRWLMAEPGQAGRPGHDLVKSNNTCANTIRSPAISAPSCCINQAATHRPLRVLQVMDAEHAPAHLGRMRISGRMADVCAELDRLAAHEARMIQRVECSHG